MPSSDSCLPLSWETTGHQWWYATPIDLAAANGHSDLVNHLLEIDPNLLIKLTSLSRIRRLETVWDDLDPTNRPAQCRAYVARALLLGHEPDKNGSSPNNPLIRAGYGGWLLYTAASAGDVGFVRELLERGDSPVAVFGEGEYGITDILYAAARSKNSEVFRLLLNSALDLVKECEEGNEGFLWELMNRAVHAAARGGNLEILKEILWDCSDVLSYRDSEGSTVLHSASARGQVEVVKHLTATYSDIVNSTDHQGNTALHVAAYKGHYSVVSALALACSSLCFLRNNDGNTFLHMAVAGFRSPGFHRIDQQLDLMRQLATGKIICLHDIINVRNNEGRTALHIAVAENVQFSVVDIILTVQSIDLNITDVDGLTPLDLLKQCPKTAASEILARHLISAGGVSNAQEGKIDRSSIHREFRTRGIGGSPGTSFRFPDSELFFYNTGNNSDSDVSCEPPSSRFSSCSSEPNSQFDLVSGSVDRKSKSSSVQLKSFLQWPKRSEEKLNDVNPPELVKVCRNVADNNLTPLREKFTRTSSLQPSQSTRERFAANLMQGVIQATPPQSAFHSGHYYSPTSQFSSPFSANKPKGDHFDGNHKNVMRSKFFSGPLSNVRSQEMDDKHHRRGSSFGKSLMNQYFCFGAQGLTVEESVSSGRVSSFSKSCRRLVF